MEQTLNRDRKVGFTLIELLVVISIIAILSVIGMAVYSKVQQNARDAKRRGDIQAIATAYEIYKSVKGHYPLFSTTTCPGEPNWNNLTTELGPYLQSLPIDPKNDCSGWDTGKFYKYHTNADGTFFQVAASLEGAGTGNFTYMSGWPGTFSVDGAHNPCDCIFDKRYGGFGIDSQQ